jgi:alkyl hydroperoxide reductase subunit AhpC
MDFEIVSISKDKTNKIQDWKDTIKKRNFNWVHYLDENGIETAELHITSWPTTFLIDSNGAIIEKNITPEKLEKILYEKFKQ